jgi:hypothetical protein
MQRTVRPVELAETIGRRQENQAAAAKESLKGKSALAERARQIRQASCSRHRYHLLANFESLKNEAQKLRRALLLTHDKLTTLSRYRGSTRNRAESQTHIRYFP